jgi:hypothetical protein
MKVRTGFLGLISAPTSDLRFLLLTTPLLIYFLRWTTGSLLMNNFFAPSPPVAAPAAPTRWRLRRHELRLIAIVVSLKALLFLFAVQSFQVLQNQRVVGVRGWLEIWNRWDSLNYQKLAQFGYSASGELQPLLVFYPLYPWMVRLLAFVTRDYLISAFVVSTIASLVTAVVLLRLVELDYSKELAQRAVWFLFIFPTSYFLHIGYTESLFMMLALSCVFAARKQRWLLAGVFGALTCLTRANGLVLLPVLVVEAAHHYWTTRRSGYGSCLPAWGSWATCYSTNMSPAICLHSRRSCSSSLASRYPRPGLGSITRLVR